MAGFGYALHFAGRLLASDLESAMDSKHKSSLLFWLALALFITWDFKQSKAIDLRFEAPLIAAGSGKASAGAHCASVGR